MNNWLDKKEFGVWCEDVASNWLASRGWHVLERNVRFREGEIDIVAERGGLHGELRFVEVKGRRSERFGGCCRGFDTQKITANA